MRHRSIYFFEELHVQETTRRKCQTALAGQGLSSTDPNTEKGKSHSVNKFEKQWPPLILLGAPGTEEVKNSPKQIFFFFYISQPQDKIKHKHSKNKQSGTRAVVRKSRHEAWKRAVKKSEAAFKQRWRRTSLAFIQATVMTKFRNDWFDF